MSAGTRVDLHVKLLDERVVRRAKARGVEAVVYAPHFTRLPEIRDRAARFSGPDLAVIPAREVFTGTWRDRKHVLAVGLTDPVPDFITLEGAMAELSRQSAAVLVPHPSFATVSFGRDDIARYRDDVHALEVYNPKHLPWHNRRARGLAAAFGLPSFASSYAHLPRTVAEAWTAFEHTIDDEADLVAALKSGAARTVGRRRGVAHTAHRVAEVAHLCYENSWQKLDRIAFSGREATHPTHPAYDGRFDGVRA